MRKWIVIALVVGMASSALGGTAGATKTSEKKPTRSERVLHASYIAAIGVPSTPEGVWLCHTPAMCPYFVLEPGERFVRVEVQDASGTATPFVVTQSGADATEHEFCGSTGEKPIRLRSTKDWLVVAPYVFGDVVCPGAVGTIGSVEVTLSNVP